MNTSSEHRRCSCYIRIDINIRTSSIIPTTRIRLSLRPQQTHQMNTAIPSTSEPEAPQCCNDAASWRRSITGMPIARARCSIVLQMRENYRMSQKRQITYSQQLIHSVNPYALWRPPTQSFVGWLRRLPPSLRMPPSAARSIDNHIHHSAQCAQCANCHKYISQGQWHHCKLDWNQACPSYHPHCMLTLSSWRWPCVQQNSQSCTSECPIFTSLSSFSICSALALWCVRKFCEQSRGAIYLVRSRCTTRFEFYNKITSNEQQCWTSESGGFGIWWSW